MLLLTGVMFLAYTPFFKKELDARVESNAIGPENAKKELKKIKIGGIGGFLAGIILIILEVTK